MGRSQKWPDLRSQISKIRDIIFLGTDDLIIFRKFHNFPWNIVAVARLESHFVVGSLDLTWWPDLTWHWVEIFTKVAEKMGNKVGEIFFAILEKPEGRGRSNAPPPPAGRGLTDRSIERNRKIGITFRGNFLRGNFSQGHRSRSRSLKNLEKRHTL